MGGFEKISLAGKCKREPVHGADLCPQGVKLNFGSGLSLPAERANRLALTAALAKALPYLLVLIAFALRLYRIDYQSIWRDEGVSLHLATSNISVILADRASNVHPPLYFILLHLWTGLAGFSELSARFFSLFFGVLLVPSLYSVVRKVFGTRTALATMAIATFSPLYVVYSQETRVYSMLPLLYLFLIYRLYQLAQGEELIWKHWIELAAVEGLCLYLHYFSIFAVAYVNLFLAALWLRRRGAVNLRPWLSSQLLVVLSSVPWAWMVIKSWAAEGLSERYFGSGLFSGYSPSRLVGETWRFFNGGTYLEDHGLFVFLSSLLAVAFVAASLLSLKADDRTRQTVITLCHWMAPLSMAFIVWWWKPAISARYVLMFTAPLFVLMGRVIVDSIETGGLVKLAGVFLTAVLVATFVLGLMIAYFDRDYFKDDVRGMVEYLESLSSADDVIIVHPLDYSIDYYYTGDASIAMIDTYNDAQGTASLEEAVGGKRKAFVAWPFGTLAGVRGLAPFFLELSGKLVDSELFRGYSLRVYELEPSISSPETQPISADFGDVRLTGAFYQSEVEADNAICLALRWQLVGATEKTYKAVVILWDEAGRRLSGDDVLLLNEQSLPSDGWAPDEEAVNYYIVPIPIGMPPLPHRITVGIYDAATLKGLDLLDEAGNPAGKRFSLGEVKLTRARDPSTVSEAASGHSFERDPYGTQRHLSLETLDEPEVADGLALEGFAVSETRPMRMVSVILQWRALRDGLPRYVPHLRLRHGDAILTKVGSSLFEEQYPTTEWPRGEVVFEQRDLVCPPDGDRAVLELEIDGKVVHLAEVELERANALFEVPPMQHQVGLRFGDFAELLGYDLDRTETTTGEDVRLILYWRVINEEPLTNSYTVFTHLLSEDGRLIGQHDGIPAGGVRPTMSWIPGEVIVDVHEMEFTDLEYRGKTFIELGLYETLTIERVLTEDGRDLIILPTEVLVKPARQ